MMGHFLGPGMFSGLFGMILQMLLPMWPAVLGVFVLFVLAQGARFLTKGS